MIYEINEDRKNCHIYVKLWYLNAIHFCQLRFPVCSNDTDTHFKQYRRWNVLLFIPGYDYRIDTRKCCCGRPKGARNTNLLNGQRHMPRMRCMYLKWETFFVFPLVWMERFDKLVWPLDKSLFDRSWHLILTRVRALNALTSVKGKLTSSLMGHGESEQRSFCGKWCWERKTFTVLR